jgi:predicted Zn finger-like uncharacterized protein
MSIPTRCPHCQTFYTLPDQRRGKKVRCRECQQVFAVDGDAEAAAEAADEEAGLREKPRPAARRGKLPAVPGDEDDRPRVRRRGRDLDDDEDEEDERPRRRAKSGSFSVLPWLLGGAAVLVLLCGGGGVGLWLVLRVTDDVNWPPARPLVMPMGNFPADSTVTLHVSGIADADIRQAVTDRLGSLVDPGRGSASASDIRGDRMTMVLAPVRDPQAFAQKIDFGSASVRGRTVTITGIKVNVPPPNADPVVKALYDLQSPNQGRRADAVRRLKDMRPDEHREEVRKALEAHINDPDIFLRGDIIEALGVWGNKESVPLLLKALNDEHARSAAIQALGRLKDERAVEPLAERLENFFSRHDAEEALKAMGPMAEKAVIPRLRHHDDGVRGSACEVLRAIGTKESLPALQVVVDEKNFFISPKAEEAIRAIKARG